MTLEYTTTIRPRIYDINYGAHVGHTNLIDLLHEVRFEFLAQYQLTELTIKQCALMVRDLHISYLNQVFWGNELKIHLTVSADKAKVIFHYEINNQTLNNKSAIASIEMVLFDITTNKINKPHLLFDYIENFNNQS